MMFGGRPRREIDKC